MENKKFFIRVESNEKIGTGHLMRCLTIANSLRKMGNQVHFISKNMSKESKELLDSLHLPREINPKILILDLQ